MIRWKTQITPDKTEIRAEHIQEVRDTLALFYDAINAIDIELSPQLPPVGTILPYLGGPNQGPPPTGYIDIVAPPVEPPPTTPSPGWVDSSDTELILLKKPSKVGGDAQEGQYGYSISQTLGEKSLVTSFAALAPAAAPETWVVCDGEAGTPNLAGRMLKGASSKETSESYGGEATVPLKVTDMANHQHQGSAVLWAREFSWLNPRDLWILWHDSGWGNTFTSYSGKSTPHNNIPKVRVTNYIKRMS